MESGVKMDKRSIRAIVGAMLVISLIFMIAKCVSDAREDARRLEAIATAEGYAEVIRETLADKTKLVVQEAEGAVDVTAVNRGMIFDTSQKSVIPYTVQYSVDLSQVDVSKIRYDDATKTMFVEIPNIVVSPPNVDESKRKIRGRSGLWTSRDAAEKLSVRTSKLAVAKASESANKPEKKLAAQNRAREKVERLLELPLRASGKGQVHVVVRFPTEGSPVTQPLDHSRSYNEVVGEGRN